MCTGASHVLHLQVRIEAHSGWTDKEYSDEAANRFTAKREQLNANALREHENAVKSGRAKSKRKPRLRAEAVRLHHCYDFLKGNARFMRDIPRPRKRTRLENEAVVHEQGAEDVNTSSDTAEFDSLTGDDDPALPADVFQPPTGSQSFAHPASAGKKKAKQLHLEGQVDNAIMYSQRGLAAATTAQVEILKEQLQIAKGKVELVENQQRSLKEQAEMSMMCATTEGLSEFGKEYLLLKQKQVLEQMKKQTLTEE
ncbi:hypothetical protein, variant [Phytophthora nicotianae P10297]|uniref:No apical meristem-associated C-terminal domain-containing protein n=1 Tax=Phytophthora nicotianae P10297 TaxID=1317064 RepID=W2YCM9_PHYNI|nr:hypothetical protein, variant [Phytophthora nicotianae P10297]